ncbi:MAG: flagellar hook assembly protein FlgD [Steroidobacteraceae bacterium]
MASTDPIAALAPQTQVAANASKKKATDLGIEDFLALMTAQLKNQDPMKPLDSTEFVAQLAQFGTVSGVQSMQTSLSNLTDSMRSAQALQGTGLVGHDVLATASSVALSAGSPVRGALEIPVGTASVQLAVKDSSGQVVRNMTIPAVAGNTEFVWDGLDDRGVAVPTGSYQINAVANIGGNNQALDVLLAGRVSSVTIDAAGTGLTLNTSAIGPLSLADVRRVM